MSRISRLVILLTCMFAGQAALGDAPLRSMRPVVRPVGITDYMVRETSVPVFYSAEIRPTPRPGSEPTPDVAARTITPVLVTNRTDVTRSPRPKMRPGNQTRQLARATVPASTPTPQAPVREVRSVRRGSVCRDRAIRGRKISTIPGELKGCGIAKPVEVTEIDGVLLSQPAIMDCATAKALKQWIHNGAKPAVGRLGGGIKSLRVAAHYACRPRNNIAGGKISEHGKGKAIDISAVNLNNGVTITVLEGWSTRAQGGILKRMHRAACGPFGTVLGPDSDSYHRDHFHFDTAERQTPYCR